jgi:protease-4
VIGAVFSAIPFDRAGARHCAAKPLVEQFTGDPLERAVAEALRQKPAETLLRDVVEAIESAAEDRRISALYLDLGGLDGGGLPKLEEVADAVEEFRASGKPVIAYGDIYDQRQYYLAAHADEIYLDPQGLVYVEGYANYGLFVKDAVDKLAIDWNVFRVGEYKSAVETFTRNDMSPPSAREPGVARLHLGHVRRHRQGCDFGPVLQSYADDAGAAPHQGDLADGARRGVVAASRALPVEKRAAVTGEDDAHSYKGVDHFVPGNIVHRGAASKPSARCFIVRRDHCPACRRGDRL